MHKQKPYSPDELVVLAGLYCEEFGRARAIARVARFIKKDWNLGSKLSYQKATEFVDQFLAEYNKKDK